MPEQRFLGEILARRGALPADKLEGLYSVQREKDVDLIDLALNTEKICLVLLTSMALAAASWFYFEKPILGLKKRFPYERSRALARRATIGGPQQSSESSAESFAPHRSLPR